MTARRSALGAAPAAAAIFVVVACSTTPPAAPPQSVAPPCAALTPPHLLSTGPTSMPGSYGSVRVGGDVTDEVVVGRDGQVVSVRLIGSAADLFTPFAQVALEKARFTPGSLEGHPIAVRGPVTIRIGEPVRPSGPPFDFVRAFVPGGSSREALWQLAGSVESLTLVARAAAGSAAGAAGAAIVAIAPGGKTKTLLAIPAAPPPVEIRQTVKTGRFLSEAGDYRIELRVGDKTLAATTVTIASGFETAIVNACEPFEKTGPGR